MNQVDSPTAIDNSLDSVPLAKALGKSIGDARRSAGLTQQELCAQTGLSYSTLAKIERGAIKTPSVFTVTAIANATDTTVEELVTGQKPKFGSNKPEHAYKTSKSGIKFVYFDVNGVLVRFFHHAFSKLAQDTGASASVIESTFWHYNDAVCRGEMTMEDFNKALASQIGASQQIDWQNYYMNAIDPIKEVQEVLQWSAEHYRVGLLSNIMPGFIEFMLKNGQLPDVEYNAVVDSSEIGYIKPEAKVYEIAQVKANVEASQILLVDDSRTNLMSAERAGWSVLWFDDYQPAESVARIKNSLEFA